MELVHEFIVPVPPAQTFAVLTDIERVAPCMPGATLDTVEGGEFTGRVKVKVGPMQVTYSGSAHFTEIDREGLSASIEAKGAEVRGSGTAGASVSAHLEDGGAGTTRVVVRTDLTVTGRPAQFGRGVMEDVGARLLATFSRNLEDQILRAEAPSEDRAATAPEGLASPEGLTGGDSRRQEAEAIDLLQLVGGPVGKRFLPILVALAVLGLLLAAVRRGRR